MGDRAFAVDLAKAYAILLGSPDPGTGPRLRLWIGSVELHCVAAYRFGRWAGGLRRRGPLPRVAGLLLTAAHRIWNRRMTSRHHVEISPRAVIGPGLLVMHHHGVIVGPSQIGGNCVLHQNVTIGQRVAGGDQGVPRIGDNVWIGPGATIVGAIVIGSGSTISAGAVVTRDIPERSLVAGNPGRVITKGYDNGPMLNFDLPAPRQRAGIVS
ncbi:serine O-acetyltransferase [Nocardioides albertanoniae]|uniref:Serine O-acetyltransferase n=1 Tax=Nocardioides albertanoniae TaxID=1175486 RepID=A0A543ABN8_9ACTN|nr:serine acetyltransferase [Nocardioides albertanoniae]TQL69979.1 serine O-acetyltransferase [Nocardioides albertanoniae]